VIDYSTFLGGTGFDTAFSIVLDTNGNAYLAGFTGSPAFPGSASQPRNFGGGTTDAFVTKIDPTGSHILWTTFLGGSSTDGSWDLSLDPQGNVYTVGATSSSDFPVTNGSRLLGIFTGFAVKLDPTGKMVYSTYVGGSGTDEVYGVVADSQGSAYVVGITASLDFPMVKPLFSDPPSGISAGFLGRINPAGTGFVFSTYLGGAGQDGAFAVTLDTTGNVYVAGATGPTLGGSTGDFPSLNGAQNSYAGGVADVFVAKFNGGGSAMLYSTLLGGADWEEPYRITVDKSGAAYVAGYTKSHDFPVSNGAFQRTFGGGDWDGFVTKVSPSGSQFVYSSYIGGSGDDYALGIGVSATGETFLSGLTTSANFPTAIGTLQSTYGGGASDAFLARVNSAGTNLLDSTYLGGPLMDQSWGLALDSVGNAYLTGATESPSFPTTAGAAQHGLLGGSDAFLTKLISACRYSITPLSGNISSAGGSGVLNVSASPGTCTWNATAGDPWISFTSPAGGSGNGTVAYVAAANTSSQGRNTSISVGGQKVTLAQYGVGCSFSLYPSSATLSNGAENRSATLSAAASDCSWTAAASDSWIKLQPSSQRGSGPAQINYSIDANTGSAVRSATITAAGQVLTLTQAASNCQIGLSALSGAIASAGGVEIQASSPSCNWAAASNASWIQFVGSNSGSGTARLRFSVAKNVTGGGVRTGMVMINGQTYTVVQLDFLPVSHDTASTLVTSGSSTSVGAMVTTSLRKRRPRPNPENTSEPRVALSNCSIVAAPGSQGTARIGASGGSSSISVTTSDTNCSVAAVTDMGWIHIPVIAGGNGKSRSTTFTVDANTGSMSRVGHVELLVIGGHSYVEMEVDHPAPARWERLPAPCPYIPTAQPKLRRVIRAPSKSPPVRTLAPGRPRLAIPGSR
jgi:hypothetical protein